MVIAINGRQKGGKTLFGYVVPNFLALNDTQKKRFRAVYCGVCKTLRQRHGLIGSSTLSYDMTFLALLLMSLYEPEERKGNERCLMHPLKTHAYSISEPFNYVADMNIALAYHKCMDNWLDDKHLLSRTEAALLKRAYQKVSSLYPEKCSTIVAWLEEIHQIESSGKDMIDAPINSTGRMLGELFCWRDDYWSNSLRIMGDGLGRFIYFMDAYDDLSKDVKNGSYNPLKSYRDNDNFESMCRDSLTMMVADCTQEFENLPIVQDADLLRNVLYSGIWSKYVQIQKKREDSKGAE